MGEFGPGGVDYVSKIFLFPRWDVLVPWRKTPLGFWIKYSMICNYQYVRFDSLQHDPECNVTLSVYEHKTHWLRKHHTYTKQFEMLVQNRFMVGMICRQ